MHICCSRDTYKIRFLHVEAIIKYIATESKISLNENEKNHSAIICECFDTFGNVLHSCTLLSIIIPGMNFSLVDLIDV